MKSVGETIKEIRKMKNLRQKDFSILSQASIASIESSKRNITIDKLQSFLDDINMSLREFEYIRNGYELLPSDKLFYKFTKIKNSVDRLSGITLTDDINTHLEKYPNDFIAYAMKIIEQVFIKINQEQTYQVDSPESFEIWSILYNRQSWTYQEIFIMSKLFYVYPFEIANQVIKRIEKEMQRYLEFLKEINFDCTFYLNVGKFYIHNNDLTAGNKYLEKALPLCQQYDKIILEIDINVHLLIIKYLKGNKNIEKQILEQIELYYKINRPMLAEDLKNDWTTFFKDKHTQEGCCNEYQERQ